MYPEDVKNLNAFLSELQQETDRGLPLVAAALIDEKLSETLEMFFTNNRSSKKLLTDSNAPLGTFSARIEMSLALGLIDEDEYSEAQLVRKIRNKFAHEKHGLNFSSQPIVDLCNNFKADLPQGADYPIKAARFIFTNAVISLVMRLYYRPLYVKKEKRDFKKWIKDEDVRWRSFEDEKPTNQDSVLMIGKIK